MKLLGIICQKSDDHTIVELCGNLIFESMCKTGIILRAHFYHLNGNSFDHDLKIFFNLKVSVKRRVAAQELGGTIFERFEANAIDWFRNRLNEITAVADLYLAVRFLGCFIKYADTLTNLDEFLQRIHNKNDSRLNEYTDTLIVQYPAIFKKEMFSSHESISRRQLLLKLKSIAEKNNDRNEAAEGVFENVLDEIDGDHYKAAKDICGSVLNAIDVDQAILQRNDSSPLFSLGNFDEM